MKILAIDTSALTASVAITDNDKVLCDISFTTALTHSETLMLMIDAALKGTALTCADIDVFALSNGPGSFTGLRIGAATIKGLAQGAKKNVVAVSTLEALAYNVLREDTLIAPIMDARRGEVYCAAYRFKGGVIECVLTPDAMAIDEFLDKITEKVIFVGDAVSVHRERIAERLGSDASFAPPNSVLQRASSVAMAAQTKEAQEDFDLIYLRKSQAEREYALRGGNSK